VSVLQSFLTFFKKRCPNVKQDASILILTVCLMFLFSGQVLMIGLITTKSMTESGALKAIGMSAREAAYGTMEDFETQELYPAYMKKVQATIADTTTVQNIGPAQLLTDYHPNADIRKNTTTNMANINWSTYQLKVSNPASTGAANRYNTSPFTCNVWLEVVELPSGTIVTDPTTMTAAKSYAWPYTIVVQVKGGGVDQTLRRPTHIIPSGYMDS
jgi:hypothetical protein